MISMEPHGQSPWSSAQADKVLTILSSGFTESISLRYGKDKYLNEDRREISGSLGKSCANNFCINGK
jgi:hypothetical protein